MKKKKIRLTSLWKTKSKFDNQEEYFSGPLGQDHTLYVFKNKYKKKDTDPDFVVNLVGPDAFNVALKCMGDDPFLKKAISKQEEILKDGNEPEPDDIPF